MSRVKRWAIATGVFIVTVILPAADALAAVPTKYPMR
jgi:hypothetical protein